jgi:hypothetical protein
MPKFEKAVGDRRHISKYLREVMNEYEDLVLCSFGHVPEFKK